MSPTRTDTVDIERVVSVEFVESWNSKNVHVGSPLDIGNKVPYVGIQVLSLFRMMENESPGNENHERNHRSNQ